ncbi:DUF5977 domain-containing protein [Chitinophaga sp. Hz27]|uniref:DUF5977 domain-containing protein n=1 Tax=Chitinophaga sp. Hz27 TaxID=3347169 RepID=UPI0035E0155A
MILARIAGARKVIASVLLVVFYVEAIIPLHLSAAVPYVPYAPVKESKKTGALPSGFSKVIPMEWEPAHKPAAISGNNAVVKADNDGGPTQPEMETFHSANNDNVVNLFSGDFNYSIPLLDVGGYPLTLGYNSGVSMDQEASWVGLGWNLNPGSITRNLRGVPDEFNGTDSITKENKIEENKTIGVTAGADFELVGFPQNLGKISLGASIGVYKNSIRGWGLETATNTSIRVGSRSNGTLTGGLSMANSSQNGVTITPSVDYSFAEKQNQDKVYGAGGMSIGTPYNSRSGMQGFQYSAGIRKYGVDDRGRAQGGNYSRSGFISFVSPTFVPSASVPYTAKNYLVTLKIGTAITAADPNFFVSGYMNTQKVEKDDQRLSFPAYGYLNYQNGYTNNTALMDFNRERDIAYRDKPAVPNIAVPSYTYDVFSISGEGVGGSFRAYRNDVGYVFDPQVTTKDNSTNLSLDFGTPALVHAGVDLGVTRAYTRTGMWESENPMRAAIPFTQTKLNREAAYFRSPGEKTINSKSFYDNLGGDMVVTTKLKQENLSPFIYSEAKLTPYKNASPQADIPVSAATSVKPAREKRTQVISYLTAKEAAEVGLSRYIESYSTNTYPSSFLRAGADQNISGMKNGLFATYYHSTGYSAKDSIVSRVVPQLYFNEVGEFGKPTDPVKLGDWFNGKYEGRLKVPKSGRYIFKVDCDDAYSFYLNGDSISRADRVTGGDLDTVYMENGMYPIKMLYSNRRGSARLRVSWRSAALGVDTFQIIAPDYFFLPDVSDTISTNGTVTLEKRITSYRKPNHISEIDVLNPDGKKYVYGIPVYNLEQKEASFAVRKGAGDPIKALATYNKGQDDEIGGEDKYYSAEVIPSYPHSFLLTGILSPDYVDVTGDGISDDDAGNAIRFNYTKTAGAANPYKWRTPYNDSATFNMGMKTDYRDDRGSYVSGSKELWYMNSVESKNMIAVFTLADRKDQQQITRNGVKSSNGAKRLEKIDLYTKADYRKNPAKATPIKTVHFEYTYQLVPGSNGWGAGVADSGRLTLSRVWFSYNGNTKGRNNAYLFYYNTPNPCYNSQSYDRWGNYKPATDNPGSVAGNIVQNVDFPYAVQDSAIAARNAAAWTLDSIVTPAGGNLKVTYESDDYGYVQNRRAMQMFSIAGMSLNKPSSSSDLSNNMYGITGLDYKYIAVKVPVAVTSKQDMYNKYMEGISKIYFRMYVKVPSDDFGSGYEAIPCYARLDASSDYGYFDNGKTIWFKIQGIDKLGNSFGPSSPLVVTAFNFLKQNLPSKAYPGSQNDDGGSIMDAVKLLYNQVSNMAELLHGFEKEAKLKLMAQQFDPVRSFVRLNNPTYKKYGGGLRVKRIVSADHWNKMTGQRESQYGKEYTYTTTKVVGTDTLTISSGVASYEPLAGGEENPFRMPIEYMEEVTPLAPVVMGYTEEPLGENLFPSASVGYSKVRVRSINTEKARSANGFEETCFYTAKDFPVITERTTINSATKKRFKNDLLDLLKINAAHYLTISQGFKIELNDMHGQMKSHAVYGESDPTNYIAYTENFYKVDNQNVAEKHLKNDVPTISNDGIIKTSVIGKDVELMVDMREQRTITNSGTFGVNADVFTVGILPAMIPSLIPLPQHEDNRFRSVGTTKVINRHGILDSVVVIDKGSKVVTHNLLFDEETGDAVLTGVQNEYNDEVYNFNYPAAWMYEGMAGAYKNIGTLLDGIDVVNGKITAGFSGNLGDYLFSGDELLVYSKRKVYGTECDYNLARWPAAYKVWVVDANMLKGGVPDLYFVNQDGSALSGNNMTMKIIRSGRRNIAASAGQATMKRNPVVANLLKIDQSAQVINASMVTYDQFWKVADRKVYAMIIDTFYNKKFDSTFYVNCNGTATPVTITVPEKEYQSVISQRAADSLARLYVIMNGRFLADSKSPCKVYWNTTQSGYFQKTNCVGGQGSWVLVTVDAGTVSSQISVEDANIKAVAQLNSIGRDIANSGGKCLFYSDPVDSMFTSTRCPNGLTPIPIAYSLPAGADSSDVDVATATAKAKARLRTEGQAYADANGKCMFYAKLTIDSQDGELVQDGDLTGDRGYENISVRFYSDAACTIPYVVQNMQIIVVQDYTKTGTDEFGQQIFEHSQTPLNFFIVNQSAALVLNHVLYHEQIQGGNQGSQSKLFYTTTVNFSLYPNPLFEIK